MLFHLFEYLYYSKPFEIIYLECNHLLHKILFFLQRMKICAHSELRTRRDYVIEYIHYIQFQSCFIVSVELEVTKKRINDTLINHAYVIRKILKQSKRLHKKSSRKRTSYLRFHPFIGCKIQPKYTILRKYFTRQEQ